VFLTLALEEGEWSASLIDHFTPSGRSPVICLKRSDSFLKTTKYIYSGVAFLTDLDVDLLQIQIYILHITNGT